MLQKLLKTASRLEILVYKHFNSQFLTAQSYLTEFKPGKASKGAGVALRCDAGIDNEYYISGDSADTAIHTAK